MGIDGLIILDNAGRPIIQSGFRSSSAAYPLLHVDAYQNASQKATREEDIDPVLYVPLQSVNEGASACCHVPCGDMRVLCPVSNDVDPLYAFAFLQTFIEILQEYFGTVTAATLKDNFDAVYQLLEEVLDAGGHPLTTFPNALRDIVIPPSLLTKLLSVAGANINSAVNNAGGPFASPIPWRKTGVRYNNNEIYFDVVEALQGVVNKHGATISSIVCGKMESNCRLSGTPDCFLTFANSKALSDCAFHPCVRLQRWTKDKALSFVPPDGRFTLFEYRYASTPSIPFGVKTIANLEAGESTLEFVLTSRLSTHSMDNVLGDVYLGEGVSGVKCTTGRGGGFGSATTSSNSSWSFDSRRKMLKWNMPSVPPGTNWSIKVSFNSTSVPRPARALRVRFDINAHTFSALKVDQLKVHGENYKPYKGVRGRSTGDVEWRW